MSDQYVLVSINVPTHNTPIGISVSERKTKREKRKRQWRKKKEERRGCDVGGRRKWKRRRGIPEK